MIVKSAEKTIYLLIFLYGFSWETGGRLVALPLGAQRGVAEAVSGLVLGDEGHSGFQLDEVHARNPVTLGKPGFSVPCCQGRSVAPERRLRVSASGLGRTGWGGWGENGLREGQVKRGIVFPSPKWQVPLVVSPPAPPPCRARSPPGHWDTHL